MPRETAEYLQIPNAKDYTGHSYRRTSGTLLADSGANEIEMLRHGNWKSMSSAKRYMAESTEQRKSIGKKKSSVT